MIKIKKGDIVLVNLNPVIGSEQGKIRPCLIIQNDISNEHSPTTIVAPITSRIFSKEFPTNVQISADESGLDRNSTILCNQIRTIDKARIIKRISHLGTMSIYKVELAIKVSLELD